MHARTTVAFLLISGTLLLAIGGGILFAPHAFFSANDIALSQDPSLLSEVRAPGGLLTASAFLILAGAFRPHRHPTALRLTVLVYGSFGVARLVAMAFDGLPANGVIGATMIELVVAAFGFFVLLRQAKPASTASSQLATARVTG